jgi:hypothetical protein
MSLITGLSWGKRIIMPSCLCLLLFCGDCEMSEIKWGLRESFHNRLTKSFIKIFSIITNGGQERQNEEMAEGILEAN